MNIRTLSRSHLRSAGRIALRSVAILIMGLVLNGCMMHHTAHAADADTMQQALEALKNKDFAAARTLLTPLAQAGNAEAQDNLGHLLLFGRGGSMDVKAGESWLLKAADQGRSNAQNSLGVLCMTGIAGKISPEQGIAWFRKAAAAGHADAQFNLGRAAEQGLGGISRSQDEARQWYTQAADGGSLSAKRRLEEWQMPTSRNTAPAAERRNAGSPLPAKTQSQAAAQPIPSTAAPAPAARQTAQATALSLQEVRIRRTGQRLNVSFALRNAKPGTQQRGELSCALITADGARQPIGTGMAFTMKKLVRKTVTLTLPKGIATGAVLEITARNGTKVLATASKKVPR